MEVAAEAAVVVMAIMVVPAMAQARDMEKVVVQEEQQVDMVEVVVVEEVVAKVMVVIMDPGAGTGLDPDMVRVVVPLVEGMEGVVVAVADQAVEMVEVGRAMGQAMDLGMVKVAAVQEDMVEVAVAEEAVVRDTDLDMDPDTGRVMVPVPDTAVALGATLEMLWPIRRATNVYVHPA